MRISIIADIHGNYEALKSFLDKLGATDEVVVLGDLVDYGPEPHEVLDTLRSMSARILRGNHDHAAAYNEDCHCGSKTRWLSQWTRRNITLENLSRNDLKFLASLPLSIEIDGYVFVHASPRDPLYEYVYPWKLPISEAEFLQNEWRLGERVKGVVMAHTHIQYAIILYGKRVFNPGSLGQPRDGDPRSAYAILDTDNGELVLNRRKYPLEKTIEKLKRYNPPSPVLKGLSYMLGMASPPPDDLRLEYEGLQETTNT